MKKKTDFALSKSSYSINNNFFVAELTRFIASNPHPRELKRALAVKMVMQNYTYSEIRGVLQVSVGFISKWKQMFERQGISGLMLKYRGTMGYLDPKQRQAVVEWLKQKNYWNLLDLQQHLKDTYNVVFASNQSYYDLFKEAGISWKKPKNNPCTGLNLVEKKQEIAS